MNFSKINTFLLIAVLLILVAVLYLVFFNKKETSKQNDALSVILAKLMGEKIEKPEVRSEKLEVAAEEENKEPTEEDWKQIYAISEKIYFAKPRTIFEKQFQKKFEKQINDDLAFCNEFYPIVTKIEKDEMTFDVQENEFYEANKEQIDAEVAHRKAKSESQKSELRSEEPKIDNKDLDGATPPLSVEERNKKILSLFEDGIPKTVKQLVPLFEKATGNNPGKNAYRIFGSMEGKFLTSYKTGKLTYYCLPEWFEGRKLKEEYKSKIKP